MDLDVLNKLFKRFPSLHVIFHERMITPALTISPAVAASIGDEGVGHGCQTVEVVRHVVVLILLLWQGRHLAQLFNSDGFGDADGVDLDVGVASRLSVLDRVLLLAGRVAVSDDDSDVLNAGSVAVLRRELTVVHDADTGGRVRVSAHILYISDGRLQ